jgi:hypothetical protein
MSMAAKYAMKKRYAKGGKVANADKARSQYASKGVHTPHYYGTESGDSTAGREARSAKSTRESGVGGRVASEEVAKGYESSAKDRHRKKLSELKDEKKKDRRNLAMGGDVSCSSCDRGVCAAHGGLVGRIMAKRQPEHPDFDANEFDELEVDPAPEADYPGSNEIGDDSLDDEEMDMDIVSRIMRKRKSA